MFVKNLNTGAVTQSDTTPDYPFAVLLNGGWMTPTLTGSIDGEKGEEEFLASLGIQVLYVPPKGDEYFVLLDESAMKKLDPLWMNRFVWSLEEVAVNLPSGNAVHQ